MHRSINWLCVAVVLIVGVTVTVSQTLRSRCYQFTWLGPQFHNDSVFMNATCQDATKLASGIPCMEPLVVSYDGSWPDMDYIWTNHEEHATCILAENDVCAQFTYYFNNRVENSTFMCTRAIDGDGQAITRGCYEEIQGSYVKKVCLCRSIQGGMPCNSAGKHHATMYTSFLIGMLIVFYAN